MENNYTSLRNDNSYDSGNASADSFLYGSVNSNRCSGGCRTCTGRCKF